MNITLRQLHGFRMVAELGSFTRAAQRLQIAQPALSLLVRDLESELNLRLFDRTTRKVELTVAGREFLQSVDKLMLDFDQAIKTAQDWSDRKRGRFVVAAPPFLASMILPGAIAEYKSAFPTIDVRLVDAQTDVIVEKVRSGAADFGVGTFAEAEEGIRRDLLFKDTLMAWGASQYTSMRQSRIAWKDLRNAPLITLTRESGIRVLMDQAFAKIGLSVRPAYEVSHITTAIMLVEAGLGIAILPAYTWGFAKTFDGIAAKPLLEPVVGREVVIARSSTRSLSPAAEEFTRFLRKQVKAALPRNSRAK
jgi:DNA-binding transcriptional LysR family regulator